MQRSSIALHQSPPIIRYCEAFKKGNIWAEPSGEDQAINGFVVIIHPNNSGWGYLPEHRPLIEKA